MGRKPKKRPPTYDSADAPSSILPTAASTISTDGASTTNSTSYFTPSSVSTSNQLSATSLSPIEIGLSPHPISTSGVQNLDWALPETFQSVFSSLGSPGPSTSTSNLFDTGTTKYASFSESSSSPSRARGDTSSATPSTSDPFASDAAYGGGSPLPSHQSIPAGLENDDSLTVLKL